MEGFKKLLEPDFEIVGMVSDGRKLVQVAPVLLPNAVLLDISMPTLNGFDAGRQLKRMLPELKLIVLTVNDDYELAMHALREWASGYLLKTTVRSELIKAVTMILKGERYLSPVFAKRQMEEFVRNPFANRTKHLTVRQREVLQLLGEGRSMKEAAAELQLAARTIAFHKYRIMEEYGLKTNCDLIKFAMKQHVVSPV
jgi:DNA-binding NarL/FixJ family response regulator